MADPKTERGPLVDLHALVQPETKSELVRESFRRFGTTRAVGRLLDEEFVKSKPYEPTEEQRKSKICIRAYALRSTEAETIELLFRELERARDGYPDEPEEGEDCPTCGRMA